MPNMNVATETSVPIVPATAPIIAVAERELHLLLNDQYCFKMSYFVVFRSEGLFVLCFINFETI